MQNAVRNAHFANIVQFGSPADMNQLVFRDIHPARQLQGEVSNPLRVAFGFLIAQIQGMRPAIDGVFIGLAQAGVGLLLLVEQLGAVDGDSRLTRKGFQEIYPIWGGFQWGPSKDL